MKNIANTNVILVVLILSVLGCVSSPRTPPTSNVGIGSTATPSPTTYTPSPTPDASPVPTDIKTPDVSLRVKRGEAIYQRISGHTSMPIMFGWRAADITIAVSTGDWNALSKEQQVDLTYYAEHLVDEIKADPIPYVTRWASYYKRTEHLEPGGEYDGLYTTSYLEQVRQLCKACWNITIGKAKRDGFYDESTPVSGSTVEEFRSTTVVNNDDTALIEKMIDDEKIKSPQSSTWTKEERARRKKEGVSIGMTKEEVLASSWGKPKEKNKSTNAYGTHEQWVYNSKKFSIF